MGDSTLRTPPEVVSFLQKVARVFELPLQWKTMEEQSWKGFVDCKVGKKGETDYSTATLVFWSGVECVLIRLC